MIKVIPCYCDVTLWCHIQMMVIPLAVLHSQRLITGPQFYIFLLIIAALFAVIRSNGGLFCLTSQDDTDSWLGR